MGRHLTEGGVYNVLREKVHHGVLVRHTAWHTTGSMGGNGHLTAEHAERLQWRTAVKRWRLEREIGKQAPRFFAHASRCKTRALPTTRRPGRWRGGVTCGEVGAAACMPTTGASRCLRSGVQRSISSRVSRRWLRRRRTVMAVGACARRARRRARPSVAGQPAVACHRPACRSRAAAVVGHRRRRVVLGRGWRRICGSAPVLAWRPRGRGAVR